MTTRKKLLTRRNLEQLARKKRTDIALVMEVTKRELVTKTKEISAGTDPLHLMLLEDLRAAYKHASELSDKLVALGYDRGYLYNSETMRLIFRQVPTGRHEELKELQRRIVELETEYNQGVEKWFRDACDELDAEEKATALDKLKPETKAAYEVLGAAKQLTEGGQQ